MDYQLSENTHHCDEADQGTIKVFAVMLNYCEDLCFRSTRGFNSRPSLKFHEQRKVETFQGIKRLALYSILFCCFFIFHD